MKYSDMVWLTLVGTSLAAGVVGGSYLKKDELLPICHALAPSLFPPIAVALPTQAGVFDSTLQYADLPWQISFVGPGCQAQCQAHLKQAERPGLPHLVVQYQDDFVWPAGHTAVGHNVQFLQAAESFGLDLQRWQQPGFVATWRLNNQHHIEGRWVNQPDPQGWLD